MEDSRRGGADRLSFYEGDRIGECYILRHADGDRHCITAFFTVKRGFGRLDAFVAGTGPLRERVGIKPEFMGPFIEDMKRTMALNVADAPYHLEWGTVDLRACSSVQDDVATLQRAGVQIWT